MSLAELEAIELQLDKEIRESGKPKTAYLQPTINFKNLPAFFFSGALVLVFWKQDTKYL